MMKNPLIFILPVLFGIVGAALSDFEGLLTGASIGILFALTLDLQKSLKAAEQKLNNMEEWLYQNTPEVDEKEIQKQESTQAVMPVNQDNSVAKKTEREHVADDSQSSAQSSSAIGFAQLKAQSTLISNTTTNWDKDFPDSQTKTASAYASENKHQPANPNYINIGIDYVKRYFTEGNLIVRVGIIVLFFGVSFLIKYSIDNSLVPIEVRLSLTFLAGMAMLGAGWHLRNKKENYALIIQGGAIAINFLTIFASFKLYNLLPASFAFPLLILFSILSMILAVLQNSRSLAVIGIAGGFAAPIMTSTGEGNHVALFSYYTVLNLAIFFTAWFKSWRMLNVLGFVFTFVIGTAWGVTQYSPEHFNTTEPFLIIFFLLYFAISILFANKQAPELKGYVDGTLVFGTPIIAFGLQTALIKNIEFGVSISAMLLGIFYLTAARLLWKNKNDNFRLLCEALLAIGIIFATLTIPLAFDGQWTAAVWAIEGAGFVWVGLRQNRLLVKYFGMTIQVLGGIIFIAQYSRPEVQIAFLNSQFLGCMLVAAAGFFTSYQIEKHDDDKTLAPMLSLAFAILAAGWWLGGGLSQLKSNLDSMEQINLQILFLANSAILSALLNKKFQWRVSGAFPWLIIVPGAFFELALLQMNQGLSGMGMIYWLFLFSSIYIHLLSAKENSKSIYATEAMHPVFFLMILALFYSETRYLVLNLELSKIWQASAGGLVLILFTMLIDVKKFWPSKNFPFAYHQILVPLLFVCMLLWAFKHNVFNIYDSGEIFYLPLLNAIDIIQILMLITAAKWYLKNKEVLTITPTRLQLQSALAALMFIWFNVIMFKIIHLLNDTPYTASALYKSVVVQMAVSISWTIIGLGIMVIASRKELRQVWFIGAILTGFVVFKLFIIDLSGQGTIERIVSFLSVGALLLVVGYFSPIPPERKQKISDDAAQETP